MKGLVLKEIYNLKGFGRILGLLVALYAVVGVITGSTAYIWTVLMLLCAMLPMTSSALDDQANWNAYAQCMPVSRTQQVVAKYLMTLIVAVSLVAVSLLVTLLASLRNTVNWDETFLGMGVSFCMALLLTALLMPAVIKFGVEKARLVIMIGVMLAMILFTGLLGTDVAAQAPVLRIIPYVLPPVAVVLFGLSVLVSVRIYEAKEF